MSRQLIVVMGPSGCGKTSVSEALADALKAPILEGDDFHPDANRTKMASGIALTDADRTAWLDRIGDAIDASDGRQLILACSALTRYVQQRLRSVPDLAVRFVLLQAPREVLVKRMERRTDHFMPVSLLDSQIEALELPNDVLVIDAAEAIASIVATIIAKLNEETQQ